MKMYIAGLFIAIGGMSYADMGHAQCFETAYVPAAYDCSSSSHATSADFSGLCKVIPAHNVQIPVACPAATGGNHEDGNGSLTHSGPPCGSLSCWENWDAANNPASDPGHDVWGR